MNIAKPACTITKVANDPSILDNSSANIPYNIILAPLPKGLPTKCFIISTFLNTSITNSGNYAFSIKSFICSRTSLSNTFLSSFLIFYSSFVK